MNMINPNYSGGFERERMRKLAVRMNRIFNALGKYQDKLNHMDLDQITRKSKETIAILGTAIAESRILADSGCHIERVSEAWVGAMNAKDSLYISLVGSNPTWDLDTIREVHDNPLAIKMRRIYDNGQSSIIKILETRR